MGGKSGGGGGGSGKISWSAYLQDIHKNWLKEGINNTETLDISMERTLENLWENNPYTAAVAYDPTVPLGETTSSFTTFANAVTALAPVTNWGSFVDAAIAKAGSVVGTTAVEAAVLAFDTQQRPALLKAIARFSAGMSDVNAVMSSAFVWGLADMERAHLENVANYGAQLGLQNEKERFMFITQGTDVLRQMEGAKIELQRMAATALAEINRMKIVANKEWIERELEISVKAATWQLEMWQPAANLLSAIQGSAVSPSSSATSQPGGLMSTLGGALSGGAGGAGMAAMTLGAANMWNPAGWAMIGGGALMGALSG
jgi:hypothetical protein